MEGGARSGRIKIVFTNAQSICNKMSELRATVTIGRPDIVAITETWTNDALGNELFGLQGYELVARCDRNDTEGGRGGGIIVWARKELCVWKTGENVDFNQCVTVRVKCRCEDINLHCIYRSPNSTRDNDANLCKWIVEMRGSNILIGDFNFPDVDWEAGSAGARGREFYEATQARFMEQHVSEPTHLSGNTLDLILSDQEGVINMVRTEGRLGKSDHEIISFCADIGEKRTKSKQASLNFRKANYDKMRAMMSEEKWGEEMSGKSANEIWMRVRGKIEQAIREFTPKVKMKKREEPPWMNGEIRRRIEGKRKAWKKWKESGRECDRRQYKAEEAGVKKLIRRRKNGWERKIVEYRKTNPKLFFTHINRAKKTRNKVAPLYDNMRRYVAEPQDQAELLNSYYASVFTRNASNLSFTPPGNSIPAEITTVEITEENVEAAIAILKEEAAAGPDNIPPRVIRQLKEELKTPLTVLFKTSIETSKIPEDWRDASVTPIYKGKGSKSEPGNYRPVSLTNVIGKVMERIVKEQLTHFVESNALLSKSQHGFRTGRSVLTNMIDFFNQTTKWLDEGRSFDVLYLDFAKAFDKVCHQRLIMKLYGMGIRGKILDWLADWLRGRKQRVRVDGAYSGWEEVASGVLQGSVLGGLLFNLFIDDIDETAEDALVLKFADDTKIARIVEGPQDMERMQRTITNLSAWSRKWGMTFNTAKCKVLHCGNRNSRYKYMMDGTEIGEAIEERDLGIQVTGSMKPSRQCAAVAKSANFALGQLLRAFHYRGKRSLIPLFKTFVRPKLEFSAAAWSPWTEGDCKSLEKVQERLIRSLSDVRGDNYEDKLKNAGLTTLRERRERGDMVEAFKTLRGINAVDADGWFKPISEDARPTRANAIIGEEGETRRELVLEVERSRLDLRKYSYTVRAAKAWNDVPEATKKQTNTNAFKNSYDAWKRRLASKTQIASAAENLTDSAETIVE